MIKLYHGDFLEKAKNIPDDSVDLVLTDPPYGTMNTDGGRRLGINGWDIPIEPVVLFTEINRILRKNGKAVLFGQEPFTSRMITEAIPNLPFSYRMIWEKDRFANGLGAKKAPVNYYEDVMVFSKVDSHVKHPAKKYTNELRKFINKENKEIFEDFDRAGYSRYALLDTFNSDSARRYNFPTETTYNAMIELYKIDKMGSFIPYEELERVDVEFKERFASTFNLWQKKKTKSNILKYAKDHPSLHPTMKPILLLEDLIKTFSNEGDLVVDLTMGSGSTGVACKNTGRSFIGIELGDEYFNIAKERIESHEHQLELV